MYITTSEQLNEFCKSLESSDVLAVDTEFVRERTYFHRIGLIQVAGKEGCGAVDPILVKDLTPLLEILKDPNKIKVFHAARKDLEILVRLCGQVIPPVFDTQVAAALVGWGSQISFAKLIQKALGKHIHKSETYTDWCRRPLSDSQIEYALDDVRLLFPVYENLKKVLLKLNREKWLHGEFELFENPVTFQAPNLEKLYMRIKNVRSLSPQKFAVICELVLWREQEAQSRDCLAKNIVRDESLLELARKSPDNAQGLELIRGLHKNEIGRSKQMILAAIQRGLNLPLNKVPKLPELDIYKPHPGVEEMLSAFVQIRAEQLKIEPSVLAGRKTINDFVKCFDKKLDIKNHPLLCGWRKNAIGDQLHLVLKGQKAIAINDEGKPIAFSIEAGSNDSFL
jgi:ribonuclease D